MSHASASLAVQSVRVIRQMNDHGAMTVEVVGTNATRHIVEYASPSLRQTLSALPVGATVPLLLEPLGTRANVWRAVRLTAEPVASPSAGSPTPLVD